MQVNTFLKKIFSSNKVVFVEHFVNIRTEFIAFSKTILGLNKVDYTFGEMYRIEELYYSFRRFFVNIWDEIVAFPQKFQYALNWFVFMYNNADFDSMYLYKVLYKKISEIEKHIREHNIHLHAQRDAYLMRICLWYLERIVKEDRIVSLNEKFKARYGTNRMISTPMEDDPEHPEHKGMSSMDFSWYSKVKTQKDQDWADKVFLRIHMYDETLRKQYMKKVFYILEKYSANWWC